VVSAILTAKMGKGFEKSENQQKTGF